MRLVGERRREVGSCWEVEEMRLVGERRREVGSCWEVEEVAGFFSAVCVCVCDYVCAVMLH